MYLPVTAIFLSIVWFVPKAEATEWLSAEELEASCDSFLDSGEGSRGALCLAYMQGFLAGAGAASTESRKKNERGETFSERASRTRLGTLRMMRIRSSTEAGYCIGKDVAATDIVAKVAAYLRDHPETLDLSDSDAVREALIFNYPCAD